MVKHGRIKNRLEDYFALSKELILIEDDILKERSKVEFAGSYQYSDDIGQVRERALTISTGNIRTLNSLHDRKRDIITELNYLENLVFNIPESEMLQILTVAFEREITGDSYRKKADDYMKKLKISP